MNNFPLSFLQKYRLHTFNVLLARTTDTNKLNILLYSFLLAHIVLNTLKLNIVCIHTSVCCCCSIPFSLFTSHLLLLLFSTSVHIHIRLFVKCDFLYAFESNTHNVWMYFFPIFVSLFHSFLTLLRIEMKEEEEKKQQQFHCVYCQCAMNDESVLLVYLNRHRQCMYILVSCSAMCECVLDENADVLKWLSVNVWGDGGCLWTRLR